MSRPLRLEYPGALYHVTTRGNAKDDIFIDGVDRRLFLGLLADEVRQQGWLCYAYCLMNNHYHLLFETPEANLCRGMQRLNGRYTQRFNYRRQRVGHVFQGRYKAILVEKESHLQELIRYVVLNPVRAGVTADVGGWEWSSYEATVGKCPCPDWLAADEVLAMFYGRRAIAINRYRKFIQEGMSAGAPWKNLRGQIYLGGDKFTKKLQSLIANREFDRDIPAQQRNPTRPGMEVVLKDICRIYKLDREVVLDRYSKEPFRVAVFLLRMVCNLPLKKVAELTHISIGRVSQIQYQILSQERTRKMDCLFKKYQV